MHIKRIRHDVISINEPSSYLTRGRQPCMAASLYFLYRVIFA